MSDLLAGENLHKRYFDGSSELHVLRGVSMGVGAGEILAIMGPSGAGKSTLLHILGALDNADEGEVTYDGLGFSSLSGNRLAGLRNHHFGFVFQFFHLLPDLRAIENVMLPAMIDTGVFAWLGRKRAVLERARELMELVGLGDQTQHKPGKLSGGERQRLAIARALMNRPRIVFCDEPTGNLDSATSNDIFELIHTLNQDEGLTLVIVTHNEQLAERADRVLHIIDGQIDDVQLEPAQDSQSDEEIH